MAAEIPVVVDIEKAFNEAAQRVQTAMLPLKKKIEGDVLDVKFRITVPTEELEKYRGEFKKIAEDTEKGVTTIERSFQQMWQNGAPAMEEVGKALGSIKQQLNAMGNDAAKFDPVKVQPLQQAIILLEEYKAERNRLSRLTEEQLYKEIQLTREEERRNFIISKEAETISQLNERLSALRGKLENINRTGHSKEWTSTGREIRKATEELAKFEARYEKVITKPGSINRIAAEMSALEQKWNAMSKSQKFDKNGELKASAQRIIEKYRQLTIESERFGQTLSQTAAGAKKRTDELTDSFTKQSSVLSQLKSMAGIYFSASGVARFIKNIRDVTAEFELQRVALGSILQDTNQANILFSQIKAAALESPFEIKELVTYTKQLAAYRIETDKLFDTTKRLADVSAGLGVDMSRLILAYGQVRAAAVLRGQELRQFTESGIPLVELLAKKFSDLKGTVVSTADVFELISKRAVPFKMIEEIFNDMTDAGGIFYQMQLKQTETLRGQWMKLKDAFSIMYDEIGNTGVMNSMMKSSIELLQSMVQNWRQLSKAVTGFGVAFGVFKVYEMSILRLTRTRKLLTQATILHNEAEKANAIYLQSGSAAYGKQAARLRALAIAYKQAALAGKRFKQVQLQLRAALMNMRSWVGIAISAITALVAVLTSADDKFKRLKESIAETRGTVDTEWRTAQRNFKRLADAAVSAADGSVAQRNAIDELKRAYGDLLPAQALQIENMRAMKGNYDALTESIRQNIELRAHEKNLQDIETTYGSEIGKWTKELEEDLQSSLGLTKERAREIVSIMKTEIKKGGLFDFDIIDVVQGSITRQYNTKEQKKAAEEAAQKLKDTLDKFIKDYNLEDVGVEDLFFATRVQSFGRYYTDFAKLVESISSYESEMNDELDYFKESAKDLGKLNPIFDKLSKSLRLGPKTKAQEGTYEYARESVKQNVKKIAESLDQAAKMYLEDFDISQYFTEGVLNFDALSKDLKEKLKGTKYFSFLDKFVTRVRKSYEEMIPTDPMVAIIRNKFEEISTSTGASMDDMQRYLKDGGTSITDYVKQIEDSLKTEQQTLTKYNFANQNIPGTYSVEEIKKQTALVNALSEAYNWLAVFQKNADKKQKKSALSFLKEELKNVQEIYKRYQDLLKYMSKGDAIKEIQKIYGNVTAIDFLTPQDYKKRLSDILKKMRAIKVPAESQQELFSAILDTERIVQDVDFSELEESIKVLLTNLSNSVKRSKEARNFFQDILSASGDQELATNLTVSIYGSIGDDLQKNIKEQLKGAFVVDVDVLPSGLSKEDLNKAIESMDWTQLTKYLPYVSQAYRSTAESIVKEAKDASKEQIKQWMSELAATRSIAQRRIDIAMKTAQTIRDINASAIPEREKQTLIDAATKKEAKEVAKLQYEAFKNSPIYVQMFDNLESSTISMLKNMRNEIVAMQGAWADLDPNQLKELESRLNKIDALIAERKPFSTLAASLKELFQYGPAAGDKLGKAALDARKEYNLLSNSLSAAIQKQITAQEEYNNAVKKHGADSQEAKDAEIRLQLSKTLVQNLKQQADEAERLAKEAENANKSYADLLRHISDGTKGLSEVANSIQKTGDGVMDIAAAFGASEEDLQSIQDALSSIMDITNGLSESMTGITQIISGNLLQGIPSLISGIGKLAKGIASLFSNAKTYEKIIRRQQKIVDNLAYALSRLEVASAKAFGTEQVSNYTDKIKNLQAQAIAYRKMADAENRKGKSRSQSKYEEYLKSEREMLDQIKDAAQELANFFAGTDLASAASSFAEAWLSAYREFGDTTTAIAEEYDKMIENMVAKSVVGEVIKNQLKPLFDTLQEYSMSGGELSVGEIANLAKQAPGYVQRINTVLEALMGELQASGLNLRVKPGQFTGISKDIAGASEEAITGLAAGINTQNFYMSHIDQTVSAILSTISGGVSPKAATQGAQEMSPYQTQSLAYMSSLPQMRDDMAAIRSMLDKVIKPTGVSSGYRVII